MSTTPKLSNNPGETIEITQKISEIKEKLPLTSEQVEEFKDVVLNLEQVDKLKEGKLTTVELAKLKLEQLRNETTEYSPNTLNNALNKGVEAAKKSTESAEEFINTSMTEIGNSETGKKAKEALVIAKEKAIEVGTGISWKKLENLPFIGGFFKMLGEIFGWIKGIFSFGDKVEEIKEKLSSEEMKKLKLEIQTKLENKLRLINDPERQKRLSDLINDPEFFNGETLIQMQEDLKEGKEINFNSILKGKLSIIKEKLWSPEERLMLINKGTLIARKYVTQEWGIIINDQNQGKFEELVKDNLKIENVSSVVDNQRVSVFEGFNILFEAGTNITSFLFGLVANGFIGAEQIIFRVSETSKDIVDVGISTIAGNDTMGQILTSVSLDDLYGSISEMSDLEKATMLRIFQRNSHLVLGAIGLTASGITALALSGAEGVGAGNYYSTRIKPIFESNKATVDRFDNIISKLGGKSDEIKDLKEVMTHLQKSFGILDSNLSQRGKIQEIGKLKGTIADIANKYSKSERINNGKVIADAIGDIGENVKKKFSLNNSIMRDLLQETQDIADLNLAKSKGALNLERYRKFFSKSNIESVADKGILYFENTDDIKAFSKLANESPSFIKRLLSKGNTIILGTSLAASIHQGNTMDLLIGMVPVIGPMYLISEGAISWKDGIKIENKEAVLMGGGLLIIDGGFLVYDIASKGFRTGVSHNILRPIIETKEFVKDSAKFTKMMANIIRGNKGAVNIAKSSKKFGLPGKITAGLILTGIVGIAAADMLGENPLEENGIINENGELNLELAKQKYPELNTEEKEVLLSALFSDSFEEFAGEGGSADFNLKISDDDNIQISQDGGYQAHMLQKLGDLKFQAYLDGLGVSSEVNYT